MIYSSAEVFTWNKDDNGKIVMIMYGGAGTPQLHPSDHGFHQFYTEDTPPPPLLLTLRPPSTPISASTGPSATPSS
ncbi:uncharacterized protein Z518_10794 [Rhinocladiella mackenziei CBS 650.93]|uniref:Uncharacterized protein n=1 Tax=Rhinocladiella mackenziei CBS 650.93 TaxID=1442369 RepID=A0A0D2FCQ0_9EURO|nr:uncharacterized protein Z518_10794 [Rhinocladiella mackenziei CBS 650.93]KIW99866.1 hypothetical protein Z518_10794 [Rhinocladiella mackenziei CBS 650.93]